MRNYIFYAIYIIAIVTVVTLITIVIYKLVLMPPYMTTSQKDNVCSVDAWSIAGIAGTVLGVGAAILTLIGAFAVGAWWFELDARVGKQVKKLFNRQKKEVNTQVDALLADQKRKVAEQEQRIVQQEKRLSESSVSATRQLNEFEDRFRNLSKQMDSMHINVDVLRQLTDSSIELSLSAATINPPWEIEDWAKDTMKVLEQTANTMKASRLPELMVSRYLWYVERLLPSNPSDLINFEQRLREQHGPQNVLYYWEGVLRWRQILRDYYDRGNVKVMQGVSTLSGSSVYDGPDYLQRIDEQIAQYEPKVEQWKKRIGIQDVKTS